MVVGSLSRPENSGDFHLWGGAAAPQKVMDQVEFG